MRSIAVIKVGGEVVAGAELAVFASEVRALTERFDVAVVHGGGPQATDLQRRLGIETRQIAGRRVTDAATLDVMKMAVAGKVNVDLCAALGAAGVRAVGLHGASALTVRATKRPPRVVTGGGPDPIDFGFVGDIIGFNVDLLKTLWGAGYTPVIASLGADELGATYNINADIVANKLAAAVHASHLFLVTSTPGVLRDINDPSSRFTILTVDAARRAIADGQITAGMIPKVEEAVGVINSGVGTIHIVGKLAPGELSRAADHPGSVGTALKED